MDARVRERPEFEPMAPVTLSIACFRYVPPKPALGQRLDAEMRPEGLQ
ncbi:MAG: hypothetical protein ACREOH_05265 [Candidatus Entotheonellia bacterium]